MSKIEAKIIADSKNEFGNRITTMQVTFPRFILAELNTHRMLSKNSASSRAIPFEKMLKSVEENPFIPIAWQKDHKGMQGTEYLSTKHSKQAEKIWLVGRDRAVKTAILLSEGVSEDAYGTGVYSIESITKQLCNRLLEPFMYHTVLITATEWENFFALRCPKYEYDNSTGLIPVPEKTIIFRSRKSYTNYMRGYIETTFEEVNALKDNSVRFSLDFSEQEWLSMNKGQAEIHMMALAEAMWDAMNESTPKELKAGEWHIPFGDDIKHFDMLSNVDTEGDSYSQELINKIKIKIATARCARVSYTVVGEEGKEPNYENDLKLHNRLAESGHWSPFEHCAKAMSNDDMGNDNYDIVLSKNGWSGNFNGFIQYRKQFNNENITS